MGGNWLLFDKSWSDYQIKISNYYIPFFREALTSNRLRIIERSLDHSKEEINDFKPNVVILKYAGEGNYKKVFNFLSKNIKKFPLMIISCTTRDLEKYSDHFSGFHLSPIKIGSMKSISISKNLQPIYQTFYLLDHLTLFEFTKRGHT